MPNIWVRIGQNNEGNSVWRKEFPHNIIGEIEFAGRGFYPSVVNLNSGASISRHGFDNLLIAFSWCEETAATLIEGEANA